MLGLPFGVLTQPGDHSEFTIVKLCAWNDVKPLRKVKIQPGSSVLHEQGENIERICVNEECCQIFSGSPRQEPIIRGELLP